MLCTFFSCALSDVAAPKLGEDGSVALARPAVDAGLIVRAAAIDHCGEIAVFHQPFANKIVFTL